VAHSIVRLAQKGQTSSEIDRILGTDNPAQLESDIKRIANDALRSLDKAKAKRNVKNKSTEKQTQAAILQWFRSLGRRDVTIYRQNNMPRLTKHGVAESFTPGIPDLVGVIKGKAIYIEVKDAKWVSPSESALEQAHRDWIKTGKDRYKTHRNQVAFQTRMAAAGAIVIVARSLADVTRVVETNLRETECPECYTGPLQG